MIQRSSLSFGAALKRYRRLAKLTQEQLAEQAGYSVSYISMLERGERIPVRATVELLADALGLTAVEQTAFESAARERDALAALPEPPRFSRLVVAMPPLAGRTTEIERINRFLADEGPPLLLLVGEPGIGKTRLLAEAQANATTARWATVSGAAQRGGTHLPYTPILEAIERHTADLSSSALRLALTNAPWLVRLLPELAESASPQVPWALPPEQERRLIFAAVARYLSSIGSAVGTLLILDDLQWAGEDALDLLASLLHAPTTGRLRVIGAYREGELDPQGPHTAFLADMAASGKTRRLALRPLAPEDAATLVREALPVASEDAEAIERIVARSGGIPFYLVSFAQSLSGDEASSQSSTDQVPWDIAQTIRQRIAALPTASRDLLEIAAVAGRSVDRGVLFAASHEVTDEDTLALALDAACRALLLVEHDSDGYAFTHDLPHEVALQEIGKARRALLHLRIAEALEGTTGEKPVEQLAYHFIHGGSIERATPYLAQAATRARAMQAYASAASQYRELAESWDQLAHHHEAAVAREQLGEVLTIAGHFDDAIEALESAAHTFSVSEDWAANDGAVARIGLAYAASGDAISGIARLEPLATNERAEQASPRERAELWDALAQLYNVGGRYGDQLSATDRATNLAAATGDASLRARIQMRHGNALRMLGRMRQATEVLEEAAKLSATTNDEQTLAFALENASVVYLLQGELQRTNVYVQHALEISQRLGDPVVLALMTMRRGMTAFALGAWDDAWTDYQHSKAVLQGIGVTWVSAYTLIGLGQLSLARGNDDGASLLGEAVELSSRSGDRQALRWAQTSLAEWDILENRPDSARRRLEPLLDRPGQQEGLVTYLLPCLAWACAHMDDLDTASHHIRTCIARAEAERLHLALVDALRVDALLALKRGGERTAAARQSVERAIALSAAMPYPYAEAKSRYVLGLLCDADGDAGAARSQWDAAARILRNLGERLYTSRITSVSE